MKRRKVAGWAASSLWGVRNSVLEARGGIPRVSRDTGMTTLPASTGRSADSGPSRSLFGGDRNRSGRSV